MGLNNMMNERKIKDIADECFSCIPDHHELRKFTELIVRECANHCDLLLDHKISSEWSRGTHDCSKAIKKYFGVES